MKLYNGDCLEILNTLPENSINLFVVDPPYGTTQNKWDVIIPFEEMWKEIERTLVPKGTVIFTSAQPFSSLLIASNIDNFKFEMIWEKTLGSGQLNIKHRPLVKHESILVFYKQASGTYNPQFSEGKPYSIKRKALKEANYGKTVECDVINTGFRHPTSVVKIANPRKRGGHPTQKPVELFEYLIKTFSNEGDLVCDFCMGSGSSGIAAINLNRRYIGIEKNEIYFKGAEEWMNSLN